MGRKGNLYTRIVRHNDSRIAALFQLKQLWRSFPIDHKAIRKLQDELHRIDENKKKRIRRSIIGALDRGYLRRLADEERSRGNLDNRG